MLLRVATTQWISLSARLIPLPTTPTRVLLAMCTIALPRQVQGALPRLSHVLGLDCVQPYRQISLNVPIVHSGAAMTTVYYNFVVPDNAGSLMAASDDNLNQMIFVFRRAGTPSDTRKDGTSGSNAYLAFPMPGTSS